MIIVQCSPIRVEEHGELEVVLGDVEDRRLERLETAWLGPVEADVLDGPAPLQAEGGHPGGVGVRRRCHAEEISGIGGEKRWPDDSVEKIFPWFLCFVYNCLQHQRQLCFHPVEAQAKVSVLSESVH